ncbi:MAG: hypothetical protein JEZ14_08360 [Marinilabiliaceae bacterium]|nr:hypothetical protein [Marinilabiliaceae bacterium]
MKSVLFKEKMLGALCLLMCYMSHDIVSASNHYEKNTSDRAVAVTAGESLLVDSNHRMFKYSASECGMILLGSAEASSENCSVLVFKGEAKQVLVQSSVLKDSDRVNVNFPCEKGEVYYFYWDGLEKNETINWSLVEKPVKGISSKNPIEIEAGCYVANHSHKDDCWYVFEAGEAGRYSISSMGLTNENTCLFVYGADAGVSIASSDSVGKSMQSKVVLDCTAGERLLVQWSNAFTNESYRWELKRIE